MGRFVYYQQGKGLTAIVEQVADVKLPRLPHVYHKDGFCKEASNHKTIVSDFVAKFFGVFGQLGVVRIAFMRNMRRQNPCIVR